MPSKADNLLLRLLWSEPRWALRGFECTDGRPLTVESAGELDAGRDVARGARVVIGGERLCGDILLGDDRSAAEHCIARFTATAECGVALDGGGRMLPVVRVTIPDAVRREYNRLVSGSSDFYCGERLQRLDSLHRSDLFTGLFFDRISRKYGDLERIFISCDGDWNQTFYTMLMRVMGDVKNRDAYMRLAGMVPVRYLQRERESLVAIEAMLLGASGLLDMYEEDEYVSRLKSEFYYLRHKYTLQTMHQSDWDLVRVNPRNHPVLRLAQIAAFVHLGDFSFSKAIECRTSDDAASMFAVEASDYWTNHSLPARLSGSSVKRLGRGKTDLIAINLIVPFQFFYSARMDREELRGRAIDLLENIRAEDNSIIRGWRNAGVPVCSAFDSQALLQLYNEYCKSGRCDECLFGRRAIKKALR